jgi:hypothetical protein
VDVGFFIVTRMPSVKSTVDSATWATADTRVSPRRSWRMPTTPGPSPNPPTRKSTVVDSLV